LKIPGETGNDQMQGFELEVADVDSDRRHPRRQSRGQENVGSFRVGSLQGVQEDGLVLALLVQAGVDRRKTD
jgi:hypothetical protein